MHAIVSSKFSTKSDTLFENTRSVNIFTSQPYALITVDRANPPRHIDLLFEEITFISRELRKYSYLGALNMRESATPVTGTR